MFKKLSTLLLTIVGLALLVFTGGRTLDLFQLILPDSQAVAGYFALVAFDGGLFFWAMYFIHGAEGSWQRGIAVLLTLIDFVAIAISFTADMVLEASYKGLIKAPANITMSVIIALAGVICLNVGGVVLAHLTDPKTLQEMRDKNTHDRINDLANERIAENAKLIAVQIADAKARKWVQEAERLYQVPNLTLPSHQQLPPPRETSPEVTGQLEVVRPGSPLSGKALNGHQGQE